MKNLRHLFIISLIVTLFFSCSEAQNAKKSTTSSAKIEIFYFHATNRCPTCNAVESNTKNVLAEQFKAQTDKGIIKFTSYNIDDEANRSLVEKYEISYSTLLFIKSDGTKIDFTDKAFQYARTNPTKYAELLKAEIEKLSAN